MIDFSSTRSKERSKDTDGSLFLKLAVDDDESYRYGMFQSAEHIGALRRGSPIAGESAMHT
jgi:hypothetical protein